MTDVQWAVLQPILQDMADRITKIEQFLAASGMQASSQPGANFGDVMDAVPGAFTPAGSVSGQLAAEAHGINPGTNIDPGQNEIPQYIIALAKSDKKIQAIKEYRDLTGASLKQAKDIIDRLAILGR